MRRGVGKGAKSGARSRTKWEFILDVSDLGSVDRQHLAASAEHISNGVKRNRDLQAALRLRLYSFL
jgi:hypothetical protein